MSLEQVVETFASQRGSSTAAFTLKVVFHSFDAP